MQRQYLKMAAICIVAIFAYANSITGAFVFDDNVAIVTNPTLRHLDHFSQVLSPPPQSGNTVSGRPLVNLSLAINYAISLDKVWSYHVVNILIHCVNACLLFVILQATFRLIKKQHLESLAVWIAILWAVHPLQTESVTYVVQRAESLMALFYLLTLYAFIRSNLATNSGIWLLLSLIASAAGMATKEVMVSAPVIVIAYDRTFLSGTFKEAFRRYRGYYLSLASTWIILVYYVATTQGRGHTVGFNLGIPLNLYVFIQGKAIALYLYKSVWPNPLVFDYGPARPEMIKGAFIPSLFILFILLLSILAFTRKRFEMRALGFLGFSFFGILSASSSIVPIASEAIAEHRMYLGLAIIIAILVIGLYKLISKRSWIVFLGLCLIYIVLTYRRNKVYHSAINLWQNTVKYCSTNPRAHFNYAVELSQDATNNQKAIDEYKVALQIDPNYAQACSNLGAILVKFPDHLNEGLEFLKKAVLLDPQDAQAQYNLGAELTKFPDKQAEAILHEREALRIRPSFAEAHNGLGVLLLSLGNDREASDEFKTAIFFKPDFADPHCNLAVQLSKNPALRGEALEQYKTAIRLEPRYVMAHYNYASELAKNPQDLNLAIGEYEYALKLNPNFVEAHVNVAVCYAKQDRISEAIKHLEFALELNPNQPAVRGVLDLLKYGK